MKRAAAILFALALVPVAGVARGQDRTELENEARTRVERGIALFDEGNYRLALVELERAYETVPSAKVLFNIGQVHLQLGQYAAAQKVLQRYLAEGGAEVPAERRAEVAKDLAMIATRVATVTIESVAGAEITIDDLPAGRAPIRTAVDAGWVRIAVSKPGYEAQTRTLKLAGGDQSTLQVDLVAIRREVIVTRDERLPAVVIGGWITTGVLTAGAVATGIAASAAASKFDTMRETPIAGSPERAAADLDDQAAAADGLAIATDILIVGSILAGGISLYLTLRNKSKPGLPASFTW